MLQRGRKPTNTVVAFQHSSQRMEPPADLTREERKVWRDVVNSKPADWFDRDSAYLLTNFCRHVVMAQRLAAQIQTTELTDIKTLDTLLKLRVVETKAMLSLANAMRISQQAMVHKETAGHQTSQSNTDKPWAAAQRA